MSFVSSLFGVSYGPTQSLGSDGWISSAYTGGGKTFAGVAVNENISMSVTAVYRAIALISEAISVLPVDVVKAEGEMRIPQPDHPVTKVLRRPNPYMNASDLFGTMQAHALQYGNGYMDVQRSEGGTPIALWPLLPDRTFAVAETTGGKRVVSYRTQVDGKIFGASNEDVAHVHGIAFDGLTGYSPLRLARQAVGLALGLEEFGAKFFGNDAKSGGFLEYPGKLGVEARKNLAESVQTNGGIDNAHRVKVLEEGMKYNQITIAPEDAQFLATRSFQVEEIARLYGVPLHMLQSHEKSTSFGSGIAQMSLGFVMYTLAPWIVRWEQELGRKLLTQEELDAGYFIKLNVNALLRTDSANRAKFYTAALNSSTGWMDRNEVRALEDLNPDEVESVETPAGIPGPFDDERRPRGTDDDEEGGADDEG